jgi:high-affinity K+ transport system ATPase subunit B
MTFPTNKGAPLLGRTKVLGDVLRVVVVDTEGDEKVFLVVKATVDEANRTTVKEEQMSFMLGVLLLLLLSLLVLLLMLTCSFLSEFGFMRPWKCDSEEDVKGKSIENDL